MKIYMLPIVMSQVFLFRYLEEAHAEDLIVNGVSITLGVSGIKNWEIEGNNWVMARPAGSTFSTFYKEVRHVEPEKVSQSHT